MRMRLDRRRKILLALTVLQIAVIGTLLAWGVASAHRQGWTGLGTLTLFHLDLDRGRVVFVAPGSPADQAGIRAGDRIVAVNGVSVEDRVGLDLLAEDVERGEPLAYEIARGEEPETRHTFTLVPASPFSSLALLPMVLTTLVVGLVYFAISLLVFWARPGSRSAFIFYLLCSAMGWMFFLSLVLLGPNLEPLGWRAEAAPLLSSALVGVLAFVGIGLFVHLALVFPREHRTLARHPQALGWVYGLPWVLIGAAVLMSLVADEFFEHGPAAWFLEALLVGLTVGLGLRLRRRLHRSGSLLAHPLEGLALIVTLLLALSPLLEVVPYTGILYGLLIVVVVFSIVLGYPILTCWISYRAYQNSTAEEKLQLRWPLWGLIVGLGGSLLVSLCPALLGLVFGWQTHTGGSMADVPSEVFALGLFSEILSKLFYLLIPVGFAFGILKHRLLDINVLIRKTLVYAALTGFVLFGYFVLVGIVGLLLITYTGIESQAWTVLSTVIIAALFVPVRNRVQGFVETRFGDRDSAEEIRQARAIQSSLLPQGEVEQLPGFEIAALWEPARTVSGDYFDVLPLPSGKLGLCIGDVSGKGMPAALLMSSLQAAVKAIAPASTEPDEVCRQVRQVVTRNLSGGKFVTFFYATLDETGRLAYCNAGHNPPILMRADGSVERLSTRGSAFARLFSDDELTPGTAELAPGDRWVLFTDGATEVFDLDGVELGEDGLVELVRQHRELSARKMCRRVADDVKHHAEGELTDDLTLLVVSA